jgi:hypothetical protein
MPENLVLVLPEGGTAADSPRSCAGRLTATRLLSLKQVGPSFDLGTGPRWGFLPAASSAKALHRKMNKWTIFAICLVLVLATISKVYWIRSDAVYAIDGPATRAEVLKVIPIGSKLEFAKSTLEAKGFQCFMFYNKRYAGDDLAGGSHQINYPPSDFLWCDSERWFRIFISKRWQIILVAENDTVVSVAVGVGLVGP